MTSKSFTYLYFMSILSTVNNIVRNSAGHSFFAFSRRRKKTINLSSRENPLGNICNRVNDVKFLSLSLVHSYAFYLQDLIRVCSFKYQSDRRSYISFIFFVKWLIDGSSCDNMRIYARYSSSFMHLN